MNAQKRVIVFRKDLLPLSETFIRDQFKAYRTWQPYLVGYRFYGGLDMSGTQAFTLDSCFPKLLSRAYLKFFQHAQYVGIYPKVLRRFVEGNGAQIIHAHFAYDAVLVYDLAKALKIPLVVTMHGSDILYSPELWKSGREGFFFRCYPDKLQRLIDDDLVFFIAVSNALREAAINRGVPSHRCVVCYTGSDSKYFTPGPLPDVEVNRVLFVGRLVQFKGCKYLIKAMSIVQGRVPNSELIIIGDGPEKPNLVALATKLGVNVRFEGAQPRDKVRDWMRRSRVFCLPSITESTGSFETFGMVILEAQLCGVPTVTSARGGVEAIRHGETGYIFAERDHEALAAYLTQLLLDKEQWLHFSRNAREHVLANFTQDVCIRRVEKFYDEILR